MAYTPLPAWTDDQERPSVALLLFAATGRVCAEMMAWSRDLSRSLVGCGLDVRALVPAGAKPIEGGVPEEVVGRMRMREGRGARLRTTASVMRHRHELFERLRDVDVVHLPLGPVLFGVPHDAGLVVTNYEMPRAPVEGLRGEARQRLKHLQREGPVRHTRIIVAPSDHVARALLAHRYVADGSVRTIHPGVDLTLFHPQRIERENLVVHHVVPGRSFDRERLVAALEVLRREDPGLQLALVGERGDGANLPTWVRTVADADAAARANLGRRARLVVETGTDLPWAPWIAEALACAAPVAAARAGALPELVGDAGVLMDAGSVPTLAAGVRRALAATNLADAGPERAREFDRRRGAAAFQELYVEVAAERARRLRVG